MKPLHFGLIGLGHFGKHYVRLLKEHPNASLTMIGTEHPNSKTEYAYLTITNPEKLLSDPSIDAVIIATPSSTHTKIIIAALEAGKHVLVEKPMAMNSEEATAINTVAAKNHQQVFMVGFQYVYNDYIQKLSKYCSSGKLGKIQYVIGEHLYFGPIRNDIGCFADAAAHELSMIEFLCNPGALRAVTMQHFGIIDPKTQDFTSATFSYENGLKAHIITSWFFPEKTRRLTIVGNKAIAIFNDTAKNMALKIYNRPYPTQKETSTTASNFMESLMTQAPEIPSITANEPLLNQLNHFIACINNKKQPITDVRFSTKVVKNTEEILSNQIINHM